MNYDPILVALVAAVQMLDEAAADDRVDPHFAVQVQEVIGSYLRELSREDMNELRKTAARIADKRSSVDPEVAAHLRRLAATRE